jgi:hypothetical protein
MILILEKWGYIYPGLVWIKGILFNFAMYPVHGGVAWRSCAGWKFPAVLYPCGEILFLCPGCPRTPGVWKWGLICLRRILECRNNVNKGVKKRLFWCCNIIFWFWWCQFSLILDFWGVTSVSVLLFLLPFVTVEVYYIALKCAPALYYCLIVVFWGCWNVYLLFSRCLVIL